MVSMNKELQETTGSNCQDGVSRLRFDAHRGWVGAPSTTMEFYLPLFGISGIDQIADSSTYNSWVEALGQAEPCASRDPDKPCARAAQGNSGVRGEGHS
jgi:hypothetical protein